MALAEHPLEADRGLVHLEDPPRSGAQHPRLEERQVLEADEQTVRRADGPHDLVVMTEQMHAWLPTLGERGELGRAPSPDGMGGARVGEQNIDRTEPLVQRALENLRAGRTSFVIAHRLSTIVDADLIVVMVEGRIVEVGPHDELLAHGGVYKRMRELQS